MKKKWVLCSTLGNLVEWYDWFAYAIFAVYFAPAFFPKAEPLIQVLQTAGIFAIGFLMRPLGGWVFGVCGDRYGRKKAMSLSIMLMCLGSLLIACAPTYAMIGVAAPLWLLLARMLQGFSLGGEEGSVATYLSETAPADRRGLYGSYQAITITLGQVLALGLLMLLQYFISAESLVEWAWRLPFLLGALLAIVAYYLRNHLPETEIFLHQRTQNIVMRGRLTELWKHKRAVLRLFFITLGGTVAYYCYTAYMFKYLIHVLHFEKVLATRLSFVTLVLFLCLQPLWGWVSDKVGRRPLLIIFGGLGTLGTIPLFQVLQQSGGDVGTVFFCMTAGLIVVSFYTAVKPVAKAELFPTEIRMLGVSFPAALITAVFGGSVEYWGLYFESIGYPMGFLFYISGCIAISWIGCYLMPDPQKTSLIDVGQLEPMKEQQV